jgi:hypothetical protein
MMHNLRSVQTRSVVTTPGMGSIYKEALRVRDAYCRGSVLGRGDVCAAWGLDARHEMPSLTLPI